MTKRELIKFVSKLGTTIGVLFVLYQNHFTISTGSTVSLLVLIAIGYIFIRRYKDAKKFCLETMLRLRESDNMRIKTPRREFFAWLFIWIHILIPAAAFYWFTSYISKQQQSMEDTAFAILIIICVGAIVYFSSLFADNSN